MAHDLKIVMVHNGRYNFAVIQDDEYIGPTIASGYEWDGWMREDVRKYYKTDTDILDIGSNIGGNTLVFSDYGPVHSFEPVYHEILNINANRINQLKHPVKVYGFALSDTECETVMYIPQFGCQYENKINYGGTTLNKRTDGKKTVSVDVSCKRLDDVYDGIPSIIKIDVEGHELNVLKGAVNTIKKHKPMILIEIHHFENSEIPKFIESLGYDKPEERPEAMYLYRAKDIFSTM